MKIRHLAESRDDIVRKIEALTRFIADKSITPGERANATKLKSNLESKLGGSSIDDVLGDSFMDDLLRSAMAYSDKMKRYEKDPDAERRDAVATITKLRDNRKRLSRLSAMGNVEATRDVREINYKLERLMKKWTPEEYASLLAKRAKSSDASYARREKTRKEKDTAAKASMASSGHKTMSKIVSEYGSALIEFTGALKRATPRARHTNPEYVIQTAGGKYIGLPVLRAAFEMCSQETRESMIKAVRETDEVTRHGITPIQKAKILKAFGA